MNKTKEEIRDQFAMAALTGILANDVCMQNLYDEYPATRHPEMAVQQAYRYADEALKLSHQI